MTPRVGGGGISSTWSPQHTHTNTRLSAVDTLHKSHAAPDNSCHHSHNSLRGRRRSSKNPLRGGSASADLRGSQRSSRWHIQHFNMSELQQTQNRFLNANVPQCSHGAKCRLTHRTFEWIWRSGNARKGRRGKHVETKHVVSWPWNRQRSDRPLISV